MISDSKKLIAFLFQRCGKDTLHSQEIYLTLSYKLGWMTPGEAKKLISHTVNSGLLEEFKGAYKPTFDYREVVIPLGFQINGETFQNQAVATTSGSIVADIVESLINKGISKRKSRKEIDIIAKRQHIIPQAAAIIVACQHNLDITPYYPLVWDAVKKL